MLLLFFYYYYYLDRRSVSVEFLMKEQEKRAASLKMFINEINLEKRKNQERDREEKSGQFFFLSKQRIDYKFKIVASEKEEVSGNFFVMHSK